MAVLLENRDNFNLEVSGMAYRVRTPGETASDGERRGGQPLAGAQPAHAPRGAAAGDARIVGCASLLAKTPRQGRMNHANNEGQSRWRAHHSGG